ncbi:DUF3299 domain-containing protein [Acuticoccus sp.]|uniref:HoxN/HupN/NixA family nickel/cobalt transporter n=1 Tax=Acuticoccus sp. TaxID=1904378 RepID=UPI003B52C8C9
MSLDHKRDLRDVLRANEAAAASQRDPALTAAGKAARQRLLDAGLDADVLLDQRLAVMKRRREAATGVSQTHIGDAILIDGYILPLRWQDKRVVEFLLVPWVGACIHTPPPPPNQIVHVAYPDGVTVEKRFAAVRLKGVLRHQPAEHDLFLIDGRRKVPASYVLDEATISGTPGEVVAASSASGDGSLFTRAQMRITTILTTSMTAINQGHSIGAILVAVAIAFAYGALHTLGPGHGKALVISYFVGAGGTARSGILMGAQIALTHVVSAVVLVILLDLAVRQTTGNAPSDYRLIRLLSYGAIVAIGAFMVWQAVTALRHRHGGTDHRASGCSACTAAGSPRQVGLVGLAVGIVPCTGALIVMLFGLAHGLIAPASLLVGAISLGMAVTMSAIGLAAIWARSIAERRLVGHGRRSRAVALGAQFAGAVCVFAIGGTLFVVTLAHPDSRIDAPALQIDTRLR